MFVRRCQLEVWMHGGKVEKRGDGVVSMLPFPRCFREEGKDFFYVRRRLSWKDKWISLGTSDPDKAKEKLSSLVDSHVSVKALNKIESSTQRLAEAFVEGVAGKKAESIPLSEAHAKWASMTPDYADIGSDTRKFYESIFRRFTLWAAERDVATCHMLPVNSDRISILDLSPEKEQPSQRIRRIVSTWTAGNGKGMEKDTKAFLKSEDKLHQILGLLDGDLRHLVGPMAGVVPSGPGELYPYLHEAAQAFQVHSALGVRNGLQDDVVRSGKSGGGASRSSSSRARGCSPYGNGFKTAS